ncbi:MAG: glucosamine-6-phosphate isomerase [Armatimonadetes bacterium]|nr:glucosamine-6-phosphate isomerase [Armatimonadota bacterium]
MTQMQDIMSLPPEELGRGTQVTVEIMPTAEDLYWDIAWRMLRELQRAREEGRRAVFIVPVGPVGQYERLARLCNDLRVSLRHGVFFGMDEYLTDDLQWIDESHPLSFRAHLKREMLGPLDPDLHPAPEDLIFPRPEDPGAVDEALAELGGPDLCVGGIGITGHIAFNEPPGPEEEVSAEEFAQLGSRVLELTCETRTINSTTVAKGNIEAIPRYAVTIGMKQILSARELRLYANRFWQPSVVRRVLHGPVTARFPASLIQRHERAFLLMTEQVAQPAGLQLA